MCESEYGVVVCNLLECLILVTACAVSSACDDGYKAHCEACNADALSDGAGVHFGCGALKTMFAGNDSESVCCTVPWLMPGCMQLVDYRVVGL